MLSNKNINVPIQSQMMFVSRLQILIFFHAVEILILMVTMAYMSEPLEEKVNTYQTEPVSDRLFKKCIDCI